jgi:hypothetical protein
MTVLPGESARYALVPLPGLLLLGDRGTMRVACRPLLCTVAPAVLPPGLLPLLPPALLLVLGAAETPGFTVRALLLLPGCVAAFWALGAALLAAAAAAEPLLLPPAPDARAARLAAAAVSASLAAVEELNRASPTSSQRMARAVAREATAWPMPMGRRSASARSVGVSVSASTASHCRMAAAV